MNIQSPHDSPRKIASRNARVRWVLFSATIWLSACLLLCLYWLGDQVWLGVQAEFSNSKSRGVIVSHVYKNGPANQILKPGDVIEGVYHGSELLALPSNIRSDPNMLAGFEQFNEFVELNRSLYESATGGSITLTLYDNRVVTLHPVDKRPLYAVEPLIFVLILAGVVATATGVIAYLRKPNLDVTLILLALGIAVGGLMFSAALLDRELFISSTRLRIASAVRQASLTLYPFATVAVFFIWPVRVFTAKAVWGFLITSLVIIVLYLTQIAGIPFHDMMGHLPVYYLLLMILLFLQWHKSKGNPIHRASLMITLFFTVIPVGLVILLGVIPTIYGIETITKDSRTWLLNAPLIVIGWGLAVYQYRLFEVERWWFKSLLWMLSGISVVLFDALFVLWLGLSGLQALPLALFVAGFVYFPLRQWLYSHRLRISEKKLIESLSGFVSGFAKVRDDKHYVSELETTLKRVFHPSASHAFRCATLQTGASIEDNGLAVSINALDDRCLRLHGKHESSSLFSRADIEFINSLCKIGELSNTARKVREHSIKEERNRILSDLHDSLGAKLLTMKIRLAQQKEESKMAGEALTLLRDTVKYSIYEDDINLKVLLSDMRAESVERLEVSSMRMQWNESLLDKEAADDASRLSSLCNLLIVHTLREGISNAIKYSSEPQVDISIKQHSDALTIRIKNPIKAANQSTQTGSGLRGLESRAKKIGAQIHSSQTADTQGQHWFLLELLLPLNT